MYFSAVRKNVYKAEKMSGQDNELNVANIIAGSKQLVEGKNQGP